MNYTQMNHVEVGSLPQQTLTWNVLKFRVLIHIAQAAVLSFVRNIRVIIVLCTLTSGHNTHSVTQGEMNI